MQGREISIATGGRATVAGKSCTIRTSQHIKSAIANFTWLLKPPKTPNHLFLFNWTGHVAFQFFKNGCSWRRIQTNMLCVKLEVIASLRI